MRSLVKFKRRLQGFKGLELQLTNLDLTACNAFGSEWEKCLFDSCQFDGGTFKSATFRDCEFRDCTGRLADFSLTTIERTTIVNLKAPQASFYAANLDDVTFTHGDLSHVSFADANANRLSFFHTNLHGANLVFREALTPIDWTGSNLWGTVVSLGCAFWNGTFDSRQCRIFAAMLARRVPNGDTEGEVMRLSVQKVAGKEVELVERLMKETE